MPKVGIADRYLYYDIFEMAAAYLYHIVRDHTRSSMATSEREPLWRLSSSPSTMSGLT
ncbi:MAG: hypothetical protein PHP64_05680 [Actinomycetota bacterium]|nr:hypothetical protein [Actinomycetota bacterium]